MNQKNLKNSNDSKELLSDDNNEKETPPRLPRQHYHRSK